MKGLYKIKIEHELFLIANNEEEAIEQFWENKNIADETGEDFINNTMEIIRIEEVDDIFEELEKEHKNNEEEYIYLGDEQ